MINGKISFDLLLRQALGAEPPPTKQGKSGTLLAIAKTDPGREYLLKHPRERVRQLMEARVAMKSWPAHIKRVDNITAQARAFNGRCPIALKYGKAATLRWAGDGGVNWQNNPARVHPLVNKIRTCLCAPPLHRLVICDFASIEARVLAWIAGQDDLLDTFNNGTDVYVFMASKLIGKPLSKAKITDPKPVQAYLKRMRQTGKTVVLGCGYGMGAARLMQYADTQFALDLDPDEADRLVAGYRNAMPAIQQFWYDVHDAAVYTTRYTYKTEVRGLEFTCDPAKDIMYIRLPSGRRIRYHQPRIDESEKYPSFYCDKPPPEQGKTYMWGGFLTENIVQAISRDLLAEALLTLIENGYKIPLHIHDEAVASVCTIGNARLAERMEEIMSTPPAWAEGLPLAAEAQICERYIKE